MMKEGTYYSCGCWHGGKYYQHPEFCPSHSEPWKLRYKIMKENDIEMQVIDERMQTREVPND